MWKQYFTCKESDCTGEKKQQQKHTHQKPKNENRKHILYLTCQLSDSGPSGPLVFLSASEQKKSRRLDREKNSFIDSKLTQPFPPTRVLFSADCSKAVRLLQFLFVWMSVIETKPLFCHCLITVFASFGASGIL